MHLRYFKKYLIGLVICLLLFFIARQIYVEMIVKPRFFSEMDIVSIYGNGDVRFYNDSPDSPPVISRKDIGSRKVGGYDYLNYFVADGRLYYNDEFDIYAVDLKRKQAIEKIGWQSFFANNKSHRNPLISKDLQYTVSLKKSDPHFRGFPNLLYVSDAKNNKRYFLKRVPKFIGFSAQALQWCPDDKYLLVEELIVDIYHYIIPRYAYIFNIPSINRPLKLRQEEWC